MATDLQILANRQNAMASTGPVSVEGKAAVGRNATRHGIMSQRLILDDEDPSEYQALFDGLVSSLAPVGSIELMLVERVAITIWRQRRLVNVETIEVQLARQPVQVAKAVMNALHRGYGNEVKPEHLEPFDVDRQAFCRAVLDEIEALEEIDLRSIPAKAPTVYGQLETDADGEAPEVFLAGYIGGLTSYIGELMRWCREELRQAEDRPRILAVADQVRSRAAVPKSETLELLSRYQTTLDNQLYKALRALREAQDWRLKNLSPSVVEAEPVGKASAAA